MAFTFSCLTFDIIFSIFNFLVTMNFTSLDTDDEQAFMLPMQMLVLMITVHNLRSY